MIMEEGAQFDPEVTKMGQAYLLRMNIQELTRKFCNKTVTRLLLNPQADSPQKNHIYSGKCTNFLIYAYHNCPSSSIVQFPDKSLLYFLCVQSQNKKEK